MVDAAKDRRSEMRRQAHKATVRGIDVWQTSANPLLEFWAEKTEEIEPELLDWIDGFAPGSVFYDLGASVGAFSIYAAKRAKARVFAFEAEAQNFSVAEINHFLNGDELDHPLCVLNIAVSDRTKLERLYIRRYRAGEHNKIVGMPELRDTHQIFEPEHVQAVLCMSLDQLASELDLPMPTYIKIDVDGSEEAVLRGGEALFRSAALREVFIEINEPDKPGEGALIVGALAGYGFSIRNMVQVRHMGGGVYPGLFNVVFARG
jgi:FkbM family methyltransferase